jgi:hypothetical protein
MLAGQYEQAAKHLREALEFADLRGEASLRLYLEPLLRITQERLQGGAAAQPIPIPAEDVTCSFCGKVRSPSLKMVAGPNVAICENCVQLCQAALRSGTE